MSVVLGVLAPLLAAVAAPAAAAQALTFGYTIEHRGGISSDIDVFRYIAAATLGDRRGWSLGGSIGFTEVTDDPDLRLVLATPAEVEAASPVCSAEWSCRVGDQILINEDRWNHGTAGYPLPLNEYRSYVINHEVGHWLGQGHPDCPGYVPAPVMMQQSKGLDTCEATVWPLEGEQDAVADRYGVELLRDDVLRRGDRGAGVAHWQADLNEATGAGLWVDGMFGPATERATVDLQRFFGLTTDGVADVDTKAVARYILNLEPRTLALWSRGEDVAEWQRDLNDTTGAELTVDGIYGPSTRGSTLDLQRFFGLPADGDVDEDDRAVVEYIQAIQADQE